MTNFTPTAIKATPSAARLEIVLWACWFTGMTIFGADLMGGLHGNLRHYIGGGIGGFLVAAFPLFAYRMRKDDPAFFAAWWRAVAFLAVVGLPLILNMHAIEQAIHNLFGGR